MTVEDSGNQNSERIWRLLQARSHAHATSINEAQARLHELVQAAKDGRPQLIGLDDHVVLLSISTLSEVFLSLQKPENWGEYFATAYDGSPDNADLPMRRYGGRAKYTLETCDESARASSSLMSDEEFEKE